MVGLVQVSAQVSAARHKIYRAIPHQGLQRVPDHSTRDETRVCIHRSIVESRPFRTLHSCLCYGLSQTVSESYQYYPHQHQNRYREGLRRATLWLSLNGGVVSRWASPWAIKAPKNVPRQIWYLVTLYGFVVSRDRLTHNHRIEALVSQSFSVVLTNQKLHKI